MINFCTFYFFCFFWFSISFDSILGLNLVNKYNFQHKLGAGVLVKILFSIISALFELNARISDCMDYSSWSKYGFLRNISQ